MAEVLARKSFLSLSSNRSLSFSCGRSAPSFLAVPRSASPRVQPLKYSFRTSSFHGRKLVAGTRRGKAGRACIDSCHVQMNLSIGKAMKWWGKGLQPNMKEIDSAQDLEDSLLNAGDKLVIVDFFSPGCGGCRALHPKICQFAEMNPDVLFLQVNYEKHKSMCYSLNVHVLPFFRFYRGAHGRLCSFSCTNATIKKFKDALAKHTPDRCSLGPARGLEEKELLSLAANKNLSFSYPRKPVLVPTPVEVSKKVPINAELPESTISSVTQESEDKTLVMAG